MKRNLLVYVSLMVCVTFFLCLVPFIGASAEMEHGKTGLRFSVQGLDFIGLGTVNGGIGIKYWMADNTALRFDLGMGVFDTTWKSPDKDYTDEKWSGSEFSLGGGVEYHLVVGKKLSPFVGAGISLRTGSRKLEPSTLKSENVSESEKWTRTSFGGGVLLGAEFFMGSHLSLTGEYNLGLSVGTTKYTAEASQGGLKVTYEEKASSMDLGVSTANLILTVYF